MQGEGGFRRDCGRVACVRNLRRMGGYVDVPERAAAGLVMSIDEQPSQGTLALYYQRHWDGGKWFIVRLQPGVVPTQIAVGENGSEGAAIYDEFVYFDDDYRWLARGKTAIEYCSRRGCKEIHEL